MTRRLCIVLMLIALIATACSNGGQGSNRPSRGAHDWHRPEFELASVPVTDGELVAAVDASEERLKLFVLEASTGEVLWSVPWDPSDQFFGMGVGRPTIVGEVLVGMTPTDGRNEQRTDLVGFELRTGQELWSMSTLSAFAPSHCGDLVCTVESPEEGVFRLVARDARSGSEVWSRPGDHHVAVATDELLVVIELGEVQDITGLNPQTGDVLWSKDYEASYGLEVDTGFGWSFELDGNALVGWIGADSGDPSDEVLVSIDATNGDLRWRSAVGGRCTLPTIDSLLVCSPERIASISPATGQTEWRVDGGSEVDLAEGAVGAISAEGAHYLGYTDRGGEPVAVDIESGDTLPATEIREPVWAIFVRFVETLNPHSGESQEYLGPLEVVVPWRWVDRKAFPADQVEPRLIPDEVGVHAADHVVILDHRGGIHGIALADE